MTEKLFNSVGVRLVSDVNELDKLVVDNAFARCEIYLQGAHVAQFIPKGQHDLLWISDDANFIDGKAIRGGIPICWPWFGPSSSGEGYPAHGFVRNRLWQLSSVENDERQYTQIRLTLKSCDQTRALWPFEFVLECLITIGADLTIELTTHNLDNKPMNISEAIHTYFAVSDINQVAVRHLDNCAYIDKLADNAQSLQVGQVNIEKATDRIYIHSDDEQVIIDNKAKRNIKVAKHGAHDTVVWNPWIDIAKGMADFSDLGYQNMLCVEAVNSQINPIVIKPQQSHTIMQTISLTA